MSFMCEVTPGNRSEGRKQESQEKKKGEAKVCSRLSCDQSELASDTASAQHASSLVPGQNAAALLLGLWPLLKRSYRTLVTGSRQ